VATVEAVVVAVVTGAGGGAELDVAELDVDGVTSWSRGARAVDASVAGAGGGVVATGAGGAAADVAGAGAAAGGLELAGAGGFEFAAT